MIKKLALFLFSFFILSIVAAKPAFAGTDLNVSCTAIGSCSISPSNTPLYNEGGWLPGASVTQRLRISNASSQNGYSAIQVQNYTDTKNVGGVISIKIHRGSPSGPVIYAANSLQTFRNDGYFTLVPLTAGQTEDYYFESTMYVTAGNEYQASMVKFDLRAGLELAANPPPSGGGGDGDNGGGGTSPPSTPQCTANPPSSAPVVSITNVGTNTVTLSWSPVSPVTHYGLIFTRISDGAQYGAPNIGNVTSYTITQLSGGANYRFQIFGVNDCAPGPTSNLSTSRQIPGPVLTGRPLGQGGQVLGATTATPTPTPSATPESTPAAVGQVLGAQTCIDWYRYIPWILLIVQGLFILFWEWRLKDDDRPTKHIIALVTTIVSIVIFYLVRHCDCYGEWSWLAWLCKWYWVVSIVLTAIIKGFSYAFLDESSDKERPPKTGSSPSSTASLSGEAGAKDLLASEKAAHEVSSSESVKSEKENSLPKSEERIEESNE
jgi:hypothetical protein